MRVFGSGEPESIPVALAQFESVERVLDRINAELRRRDPHIASDPLVAERNPTRSLIRRDPSALAHL
jgi:hypothetical protein